MPERLVPRGIIGSQLRAPLKLIVHHGTIRGSDEGNPNASIEFIEPFCQGTSFISLRLNKMKKEIWKLFSISKSGFQDRNYPRK